MFKKNDNIWVTSYNTVKVILVIEGMLFVIASLLLSIIGRNPTYLILLIGCLGCWIGWVICKVVFSYFLDVKIIRDKLYENDNQLIKTLLDKDCDEY